MRRVRCLIAVAVLLVAVLPAVTAADSFEKGQEYRMLDTQDRGTFSEISSLERWLSMFSVFSTDAEDRIFDTDDTVPIDHTLTSALESGEQGVDASDTIIAVETYKCHDSGCDDPLEDKLVEELSWRTGPDAVGSWTWSSIYRSQIDLRFQDYASFTVVDPVTRARSQTFEKEGTYATVIYVVDTANNRVVSEVYNSENQNEDWRFKFDVMQQTDTGDADEGDTNDDDGDGTQPPEVIAYKQPDVTVEDGTVTATAYFENSGSTDMASSHILEMQPRPKGKGMLSVFSDGVFVGSQDMCDSSHPENVYKPFRLDAGAKTSITLTTDAVEPGQEYDVYLITGTGCYPDGRRTFPYGNGFKVDTVCVGNCDGSDGLPLKQIAAAVVGLSLLGYGVMRLR